MVAILVCDKDERESAAIGSDCRSYFAAGSEEMLQLESATDDAALCRFVEDEKLVHLLYYDFRKGQTLNGLRQFRKSYADAMVMLITDTEVSPLEYLRPGVTPDSLMLRPVDGGKLREINGEFLDSFFERFSDKHAESSFVVNTREEKVFIPYANIYYFEARDKKLFVRTKNEEYAFYDTIEALEERLPEGFRRCHRSYIVNTGKIRRIMSADNYVELGDRIGVPISRSYRSAFKGVQA